MTFSKLNGFWYKPHRGSLFDSVNEARYFETFEQLCDYLEKEWNLGDVQYKRKEDIFICAEPVLDSRIGAKLHYVGNITRGVETVPQCFGHIFQEVDLDVWNSYRDSVIKEMTSKKEN